MIVVMVAEINAFSLLYILFNFISVQIHTFQFAIRNSASQQSSRQQTNFTFFFIAVAVAMQWFLWFLTFTVLSSVLLNSRFTPIFVCLCVVVCKTFICVPSFVIVDAPVHGAGPV